MTEATEQPKKLRYIARVYVVVEAESESDAADAMTGALSETLKYSGSIVDWSYSVSAGHYDWPRLLPANAPADLDPQDITLTPDFDDLFARREPATDGSVEPAATAA